MSPCGVSSGVVGLVSGLGRTEGVAGNPWPAARIGDENGVEEQDAMVVLTSRLERLEALHDEVARLRDDVAVLRRELQEHLIRCPGNQRRGEPSAPQRPAR